MVLQKVGETITEILVNGSTKWGPSAQDSDSAYDVSVSANASLRHDLNGDTGSNNLVLYKNNAGVSASVSGSINNYEQYSGAYIQINGSNMGSSVNWSGNLNDLRIRDDADYDDNYSYNINVDINVNASVSVNGVNRTDL